tara:strand:+ start:1725 stop:4598 length:2874 start_codon:yes stop_codon:yes gene_type:complete
MADNPLGSLLASSSRARKRRYNRHRPSYADMIKGAIVGEVAGSALEVGSDIINAPFRDPIDNFFRNPEGLRTLSTIETLRSKKEQLEARREKINKDHGGDTLAYFTEDNLPRLKNALIQRGTLKGYEPSEWAKFITSTVDPETGVSPIINSLNAISQKDADEFLKQEKVASTWVDEKSMMKYAQANDPSSTGLLDALGKRVTRFFRRQTKQDVEKQAVLATLSQIGLSKDTIKTFFEQGSDNPSVKAAADKKFNSFITELTDGIEGTPIADIDQKVVALINKPGTELNRLASLTTDNNASTLAFYKSFEEARDANPEFNKEFNKVFNQLKGENPDGPLPTYQQVNNRMLEGYAWGIKGDSTVEINYISDEINMLDEAQPILKEFRNALLKNKGYEKTYEELSFDLEKESTSSEKRADLKAVDEIVGKALNAITRRSIGQVAAEITTNSLNDDGTINFNALDSIYGATVNNTEAKLGVQRSLAAWRTLKLLDINLEKIKTEGYKGWPIVGWFKTDDKIDFSGYLTWAERKDVEEDLSQAPVPDDDSMAAQVDADIKPQSPSDPDYLDSDDMQDILSKVHQSIIQTKAGTGSSLRKLAHKGTNVLVFASNNPQANPLIKTSKGTLTQQVPTIQHTSGPLTVKFTGSSGQLDVTRFGSNKGGDITFNDILDNLNDAQQKHLLTMSAALQSVENKVKQEYGSSTILYSPDEQRNYLGNYERGAMQGLPASLREANMQVNSLVNNIDLPGLGVLGVSGSKEEALAFLRQGFEILPDNLLPTLAPVEETTVEADASSLLADPSDIRSIIKKVSSTVGPTANLEELLTETINIESAMGKHPDTYTMYTDPKTGLRGSFSAVQLDEVRFNDIQKRLEGSKGVPQYLTKFVQTIIDEFGFDPRAIKYEDLKDDTKAVIFARLAYAMKKDPIPNTVQERGKYWKKHYNSYHKNAKGTVADYLRRNKA